MSFKLNKAEASRREELGRKLTEAYGRIAPTVDAYNAAQEDLRKPVEEAITAYNEILGEAEAFAEEVAANFRREFDEKSRRWRGSDKGTAINNWIEEWESLCGISGSLDAIEVDWPEDLRIEEPIHAEALEGVAEEPERQ